MSGNINMRAVKSLSSASTSWFMFDSDYMNSQVQLINCYVLIFRSGTRDVDGFNSFGAFFEKLFLMFVVFVF